MKAIKFNRLFVSTTLGLLLSVSNVSLATVTEFSHDFEGLAHAGSGSETGTELSSLGWLVGANVYDGSGTFPGSFKFFFGLFAAPNGGAAFSAVATGDATNGGIGVNYLNVYSDYNCCDLALPTPQGHGNGTDVVNALVVQEFNITADDIGKSVTFTFDAKRPDFINDGFGGDDSSAVGSKCSGTCIASAFVKTLDPGAGFSTTNLLEVDTTAVSQSAWETHSITLDLTDYALDGQILQVGFQNLAGNFDNTGVYYDNISLTLSGESVQVPIPFGALAALALGLVGISVVRNRK